MFNCQQLLAIWLACISLFIGQKVRCVGITETELMLFTVATDSNDGYQRFLRSATIHGYNITVLGRNRRWQGGDILHFPGGGQKVNLLREAIAKLDQQMNNTLIIMFVDSYDVVLTAGPTEVIRAFKKFNANVVFSAEAFCWPDSSLMNLYPPVKVNEKRYLNSGGYIGYLGQIIELLVGEIKDDDDDQLYFTKQFLDQEKLSVKMKIKLDTRSTIFQNLNGALDEIAVKFKGTSGFVYNFITGTVPIVIHGNGPIKTEFNSLTNYLVSSWVPKHGCLACREDVIDIQTFQDKDFPTVLVAIFINYPTVFLEDFFQRVVELVYPKNYIDVFIYFTDKTNELAVSRFTASHGSRYRSIQMFSPNSGLDATQARNLALKLCEEKKCDYYFAVDSCVQLENVRILEMLISQNRSVIAPMMSLPGRVWSNFWGALSADGFYKRSMDYIELVERRRMGLWNVPYVANVYLVRGNLVNKLREAHIDESIDFDMAFCKNLRELSIFMLVDNQRYYGHLTDSSNYDVSHLHNDLYAISDNRYTWEMKYIDPEYYLSVRTKKLEDFDQPCRDVFTIPFANDIFCQHLVEELEYYGQWSYGNSEIADGFENVPTAIHLNQVGFEKQWLHILHQFITPVNAKLYEGYTTDEKALMNFVFRYRPGEQDSLANRNHASTFTVVIALNRHGIDFQGGGTRFVRYNCTITNPRVGWLLIFPGRLTHQREILGVTEGTRYELVSFVDP